MLIRSLFTASSFVAIAWCQAAPTVKVEDTPEGGLQPQVAMDGKGALHLIYYKGDPAGGDVFYVRKKPGEESFSKPIRVNSVAGSVVAAGTIRGARIAAGKDTRVHVLWNGSGKYQESLAPSTGGKHDPKKSRFTLYTRMKDGGSGFEEQRNLMQTTFGLDGGGDVAADSKGNVYAVWHGLSEDAEPGEENRAVFVVHSKDNGKTFGKEQKVNVENTGVCGCCGLAAFANREGALYVAYRGAIGKVERDMYLLVSQDQGQSFLSKKLDSWRVPNCPMSSYSFLDGPESVYAAWETERQVLFSPLGEKAKPLVVPGAPNNRKHPRLATNNDGAMLLVWTEGTGWNKGGDLAWQVYDKSGQPTEEKGLVRGGVRTWSFGAAYAKPDGTFVILH